MDRSRFKVSHHPLPPPLKTANVWYVTQLKGINLKNISTCHQEMAKGTSSFLPPFLSSLITVQIEGHHRADERRKNTTMAKELDNYMINLSLCSPS